MPRRIPGLRLLAAFEAVARLGSATLAARELGVTHGAVSHALRALEAEVGVPLFERTGRGLRPTAAARTRAAQVRQGLDVLEAAFAPPARFRPGRPLPARPLVASALPALAPRWLLPRLRAFRRACPGVAVEVRPDDRPVEDFAAEGVDVALRYGPGGWPGVAQELLARERVFPVCAPGFRRGRLPASAAAVARCPLLRHPRQDWAAWLATAGADPPEGGGRIAATLGDAGLVLDAAAAGQGVALARSLLAADALRRGELVRLTGIEVVDAHGWWLVLPADGGAEHPGVAAFRGWVRRAMARTSR